MKAVAHIFPFRTNNYIVEDLIDWDNIPDDPIYRLNFPHPNMTSAENLDQIIQLLKENAPRHVMTESVNQIRRRLNPLPGGQQYNVPLLHGKPLSGVQHKYSETALFFPNMGQTCYAYCTFCFRWRQFVSLDGAKQGALNAGPFMDHIKRNTEITDVLYTGGDPMTMMAHRLSHYIEPLLGSEFDHIQTIRIGTKSIANWPYRYITDKDADELLSLFEKIVQGGKHLAIMAHFTHYKELEHPIAREAIARIRSTGAQIRTQSPVINHINDSEEVWARMWQMQVRLGCIPYYMFVERPTGASDYFQIPIIRAWEIYQGAIKRVSGLARTARGPIMSSLPGKIAVEGVARISGQKLFTLSFLQARDANWCKRPFFARYDPKATWFTDLKPAFGEDRFFFDEQLQEFMKQYKTT